uniref:GMA12/MNN10 family galactosyl transferase n=1 Tax=Megaviridae environmental sample TaxID=1737588 RepID=A0A5J6VKF9_9VIRU|nr:MAG: GMA12/MNN10 family galactosyl transferase [Megaviridae environmental sample]
MKLTFVLPLSTGKDIDLGVNILLPSMYSFFKLEEIQNVIIIIAKQEIYLLNLMLQKLKNKINTDKLNIKIIEESIIGGLKKNGYYFQMYLKLIISKMVQTKFYVTLDADIYFCKKCSINSFCTNEIAYYRKINKIDTWCNRCEQYLNIKLSYQTNQTPFVFITSYVIKMLSDINVHDLILNKKCSEYTLYLSYMLKYHNFDDFYQNKDFCFENITNNNHKNLLKPSEDIILESFLLQKDKVLNCIQSRLNIHTPLILELKKHIPLITYKKPNIALLTVVTDDLYYELYESCFFFKKNYCKYHNYVFEFDIIKKNKYEYSNGWLKIYKLKEILHKYDYVFLSDADVILTNRDIRIEDIISESYEENIFMYITTDFNSINSGNTIWKNCKKSFQFIDTILSLAGNDIVYTVDYPYKPIGIYEQPAIIYTINTNTEFSKFIKITHQYKMNSYLDFGINSNDNSERRIWQQGDFLIHLAGYDNFTEIKKIIKKYSFYYKFLIVKKEGNDYGKIL